MSRESDDTATRYRELWAEELAGATLYRALAERTKDPGRKDVFTSLAEAEARHADHWLAKLAELSDGDPKPPRLPFRTRTLVWLTRWLGPDAVLSMVQRGESAAAAKYGNVADAPEAMAEQEAAHVRVVAALRGGDSAGGRIAASEGRHRAGAGGALRAAVFGVNDGLVSNLSLVMGVAGGTSDRGFVVLAGVAGLVAGAFSMAAGEWVSVRSQRELYENELRIERAELAEYPAEEAEELELIYRAKGIDADEARSIVERIMRSPDVALDTMAREELGIDPGSLGSPWVAAVFSFAAFAIGAVLPLIPFVLLSGTAAIGTAAAVSAIALMLVGAAISVFTGRPPLRSGVRMVAIGALAAGATFGIGTLVGAGSG
ncbi:MAG TPA: VIT1/CCC1 transporter family protein [Acidimicrobiia bacterium]|nr:VIT1/CCC1 transporter family protein [Acidimicrobiia bacterium]